MFSDHLSTSAARNRKVKRSGLRRQLFGLQQLDQRMLLAGDLAIDSNQQASLIDSFDQLSAFGDRLDIAQPLTTFVPLGSLSGGDADPIVIGQQLDIGSILSQVVSTPATNYLESTLNPTSDGLKQAIETAALEVGFDPDLNLQLQNTSVVDESSGDNVQFKVSFLASRIAEVDFDFANQLPDAAAQIDGVFSAPLNLEFGFDAQITATGNIDESATPQIQFGPQANNFVRASLDHTQQEPLTGQFGFLGFDVQSGSVDYDLNIELALPTDGLLPADLVNQPLDSVVQFDTSSGNNFLIDLPIIVQSDGLDLGANPADADKPRIEIRDENLFDDEFDNREPFFTMVNAENLVDFKTVTAVGVFTALNTVQDVFASVHQLEAFQKEIPLTGGQTLADVLDVSAALTEQLTGPLGLSSSESGEDETERSNDDPGFQNVQQLVNQLASRITYSADDDGDSSTHDPVITFDVDFHHLFDVASFDADFDFDLGDVTAIETDSTIDVEAELDAKFQIGVLLRRAEGGLPLTRETPIGDLNAGAGVDLSAGTIDLNLRNGRLQQIDVSDLTPVDTLGTLIERIEAGAEVDTYDFDDLTTAAQAAISADPIFGLLPESIIRAEGTAAGMVRVMISDEGDALQIVDTTRISIFSGDLTPATFDISGGDVAESLGLTTGRADAAGVTGRPINGRFAIDRDTLLDDLNRGRGVQVVSPAEASDPALNDISVTLASGATFFVDLSDATTIGDVIDGFVAGAANATDPATGASVTVDADDFEITFNDAYTGLSITDQSEGVGELKVAGENGSLAAVALGIAGIGNENEDGTQRSITGSPLHGNTIADSVFIRQVAAASGTGASLTSGNATFELGNEIAASGTTANATASQRIQLDAGTDLSGVFPGDRLQLDATTFVEIVEVHDRDDAVDVTDAQTVTDVQWKILRDVNLSRVEIGDEIRIDGRTDGIDGSDLFEIVSVDDTNDTVQVAVAPTDAADPTQPLEWTIDRLAPMFSGTGRLISDDVDAAAKLGFIDITIENGSAVGQLTADISLGDTGTDQFDDRITLAEAYDGLSDAALNISGRNEITFPQTASETYGGVLKLTIDEPNGAENETVFAIPFYVPPLPPPESADDTEEVDSNADSDAEPQAEDPFNLRAKAIAAQLNLALVAVEAASNLRAEVGSTGTFDIADLQLAISELEPARIGVGSSGDRLTFSLKDGVARQLTASAGAVSDLTNSLGLSDDDVAMIMKVLAAVPGTGVDRATGVDDLHDSTDALLKLGITDDLGDPSAYVVAPKFSGAGELNLPTTVDLELPGFSPSLDLPVINVGIPDLSLGDFSLPGALDVDLSGLGDLASLGDLSLSNIIRAMQAGLGFLEGLEGFDDLSFFNADLPLLDLNLRDMLQIADLFGDIIIQLELNPVDGLGLVEEFLEDAFGLPEDRGGDAGKPSFAVFSIPELNEGLPEFGGINLADRIGYLSDPDADLTSFPFLENYLSSIQGEDGGTIELSLDRDGTDLALRLDIEVEVAQVQRQGNLSVDLASLGSPALSQIADTSASAAVDVDAGAVIGLSLGIDLTHEDGIKPFLYDMQGSGDNITGTRVELLANAEASDIDFTAALGPLGIEITDGNLNLSGPIDVDPSTGEGKAKFTVGLGSLLNGFGVGGFGLGGESDGRHYLEEIAGRGDTIAITSGRRAELTAGNTTITLPATSDLSDVLTGDTLIADDNEYLISAIDTSARTVTVAVSPTQDIASAAWEIVRSTQILSGSGATVSEDLTTITLPAGTDISRVEVDDWITLPGQTGGSNGEDTFRIKSINEANKTLRLDNAPRGESGTYDWSIARNGDFQFLLDLSDLQVNAVGTATASLPISFLGLPGSGTLIATVGDLTDITSTELSAEGDFLNAALDALRGDFNLSAIVGGFESAFGMLGDALDEQVFSLNIPLIGDALQSQADFMDRITRSVLSNLKSNEESGQNSSLSVQQALYDALGPGGLNWLKDLDTPGNVGAVMPDGAITIDDVVVRQDLSSNGPGFVFDVQIGQDLVDLSIPAGFDLGIPGLELDLNAPVDAKLGFDMRLTMGLNIFDGFYIQTGANGSVPEVQVYLDASVPGLSATGELAFLRIDANDLPTAQSTLGFGDAQLTLIAREAGPEFAGFVVEVRDGQTAGNETVEYDKAAKTITLTIEAGVTTAEDMLVLINEDLNTTEFGGDFYAEVPRGTRGRAPMVVQTTATIANRASNFRGTFGVDLVDPNNDDGKLTTGEIFAVRDFSDIVEVKLDGVADLNFQFLIDMNGVDFFPSLRTNFGLDWVIGLDEGFAKPTIQFTDVEMNLGEFFDGFVDPVLGQVQDVIEPLQPVIDAITAPLPVISDLAGMGLSAVDLAKLYGGTAKIAGFVDGVAQVVSLINSLPDLGTSEWVNVGGFRFDADTSRIVEVFGPAQAIFDRIRDAASSFDPSQLSSGEDAGSDQLRLDFPILTNPSLLFDLLLGQDVDLFTLELPTFEVDASVRQFYPIPAFPILGAEVRGNVGAEIDFAFGYDTTGLRRFFNTGSVTSIADGFFLFDHQNADGSGADIPELTFSAGVSAGPAVRVPGITATVQGGVFADVFFNLHDNNDDGRIRGLELADNALLDNSLIHIFDVNGVLDARLFAEIGIDLGLFSVSESFTLAEIELLNYNFPRPDGNTVALAEKSGSTLKLNIGPRAHLRNNPVIDLFDPDHDEDNNEDISISAGPEPNSVVVSMLGREQTYFNITRIKGDAGLGNDTIRIQDSLTIPVSIYGGPGADNISGGAGDDVILGGRSGVSYYDSFSADLLADGVNTIDGRDGNDVIVGGTAADVLHGGDGRDRIRGGEGDDLIVGGAGDDDLSGEAGEDILQGDGGSDRLRGGDGRDLLQGNAGGDRLFGDAGDDRLVGGRDADLLEGGDGDDVLLGEEGADVLRAGAGNDFAYGGVGNDVITGGDGDDQLFGENSRDRIYGDAGNDLLVGGLAGDDLFGGLGDDQIFATDQDGTVDPAVHLIHGGGGNDVIYAAAANDTIYGDRYNDLARNLDPSTDGDDVIYALAGDDIIYAGGGDDQVFGGLGADDIWGGEGNDRLFATDEFDSPDPANTVGSIMVGGPGDDLIRAQNGDGLPLHDTIHGDGPSLPTGRSNPNTDGHDVIFAFQGDDFIETGNGDNVVHAAEGNDVVIAGEGMDRIDGGDQDDWIVAGLGDDNVIGGEGNDVLFGGLVIGTAADFDISNPANFQTPDDYATNEAEYPTGYEGPLIGLDATARFLVPTITPESVFGVPGDGRDTIDAGPGVDFLYGGFDADVLDGGDGIDYVDAGGGNDLDVTGGAGDDVVLGGHGNDALQGGEGIDQVYGNEGDDVVFGEAAGSTQVNVVGQRLYGNDGRDQLFAYAPTTTVTNAVGEQLFGGADGDFLRGNLLNETFVGGSGNDYIHGDILAGPNFATNTQADLIGGNDLIFGGSGEDQLFGGGGHDTMWGGAGSDIIEGQAGADVQFGGGGIDLFVAPSGVGQSNPTEIDVVSGHFGNATAEDVLDDNATDILVINGTGNDDTIVLSQTTTGDLHVTHPNGNFDVVWRDLDGNPLIEQFQIAGLGGHDKIGFATEQPIAGLEAFQVPTGFEALDLSRLVARSNDFVGVFDGNSGNDLLVGAEGRDRLDGGRGSDIAFGFAGDDRLWGDNADGLPNDHDVLFAGQGNDDLLGGVGQNSLHAWSFAPDPRLVPTAGASFDPGDVSALVADGPDANFGVFVDSNGNLFATADDDRSQEVTGLNRVVGGIRDDSLFGGTALDFLYGNGGNDTLFRSDGTTFTSLDGGLAGDEWLQYARESDQVWYVGGTNAKDEITVDFVTEPGVLADHHLITRLTDNNGNVSFSAQVRLDFDATDDAGNRIWDPNDLVTDASQRLAALDELNASGDALPDEQRDVLLAEVETATTALNNNLLPSEGDFLAIVIDAMGGNDEVVVGPTVQKSVWIDAGAGDDVVEIRGGNSILVDRSETSQNTNGLRGRNDSAAFAFPLLGYIDGTTRLFDGEPVSDGAVLTGLTIDNPQDEDWYEFTIGSDITLDAGAELQVASGSPIDEMSLRIFSVDADGNSVLHSESLTGSIALGSLTAGVFYQLQVTNQAIAPTPYDLRFVLNGVLTDANYAVFPVADLGLRVDAVRRDVIVGGTGNDVLRGGAGEDFIFGGEGADVITGGADRNASDIVFGGPGDDTFQIIPDALPLLGNQDNSLFDPGTATFLPTFNDQLRGGDGDDRVLFLGGDVDRTGTEVPDFVSLRYNTALHRYEFTSLVWDIANQEFLADPDDSSLLQQHYMFFQANDVEYTQIITQAGDDVVHADPTFQFLPTIEDASGNRIIDPAIDASLYSEWGIDVGDAQQRATLAALQIHGGDGDDILYGGAEDDQIFGDAGDDIIVGANGNDILRGGTGDDTVIGFESTTTPTGYPYPGTSTTLAPELFQFPLAAPRFAQRDSVDSGDPSLLESLPALQGDQPDERLSELVSIGDFDDDGFEDFVAIGQDTSYVMLRPVELSGEVNVHDFAEIVIDHATLGRPASSQGDINGDGISDLVLVRGSNSETTVTTIFGNGLTNWPREWGGDFAVDQLSSANSRQVVIKSGELSPADLSSQVFNHDNDAFADILLTSATTEGTLASRPASLAAGTSVSSFDGNSVTLNGQVFFLSGSSLISTDIIGNITSLFQLNGGQTPERIVVSGDRVYAASRDLEYFDTSINAQGKNEILEEPDTAGEPIVRIAPETLSVNADTGVLFFSGENNNSNSSGEGNHYLYSYDPSLAANAATDTNSWPASNGPWTQIELDGVPASGKLLEVAESFDSDVPLYFVSNVAGAPELFAYSSGSNANAIDFADVGSVTSISDLTIFDGDLYFAATVDGKSELWQFANDIFTKLSDVPGNGLQPQELTVFQDALYFRSEGELSRYTPAGGIEQVSSLNRLAAANPANMIEYAGQLFFTATGEGSAGPTLWRYDGDQITGVDDTIYDANSGIVAGGEFIFVDQPGVGITQYGQGNLGFIIDGQSVSNDAPLMTPITYDGAALPESGGFRAEAIGDINNDGFDDIVFQDPDIAPVVFTSASVTGYEPANISIFQSGSYQLNLSISVTNNDDASRSDSDTIRFENIAINTVAGVVSQLNTEIAASDVAGLVVAGEDNGSITFTTVDTGGGVSIEVNEVEDFTYTDLRNLTGYRSEFPAVYTVGVNYPASGGGIVQVDVNQGSNESQDFLRLQDSTANNITELVNILTSNLNGSGSSSSTVIRLSADGDDLVITTALTGSDVILYIEDESNSDIQFNDSQDCDDSDGGNSSLCTRLGSSRAVLTSVGSEVVIPEQAGYRGVYLSNPSASAISLLTDTTNEFSIDASDRSFAIGDVNDDGFADWATTTRINSGLSEINIYAGSTGSVTTTADYTIPIAGANSANLTAGDFNHDGEIDLAVATEADTVAGSHVSIINSIGDYLGTSSPASISDIADKQLTSTSPLDQQSNVVLSTVDFNGDQVADLGIALPNLVAENGSLALPTGAIHVAYGQRDTVAIPLAQSVSLATISVPGSGAYAVDRGTGRPQIFTDNGDPFQTSSTQSAWFDFATLGDGQAGQYIRVASSDDVIAHLFDADGREVGSPARIIDLRTKPAGDYYLRVDSTSAAPVDFTVEVAAPIRGQTHATSLLPDRDQLYGDSGNDILVGNFDIDALFGGTGADSFTGESIEVRDLQAIDTVSDVELPQQLNVQRPVLLDPVIDVSPTLAEILPFDGPFRASQLAQLESLIAPNTFVPLFDLTGLDAAINLRTLALPRSDVFDISLLEPRTLTSGPRAGQPAGAGQLEVLDLSENDGIDGFNDITTIGMLTNLRVLNLDFTLIDFGVPETGEAIANLTNLEELHLQSQLPQYAVAEGDVLTFQRFDPGPWTISDFDGNVIADSNIVEATGPFVIEAREVAPSSGRLADVSSAIDFAIEIAGTTTSISLPVADVAAAKLTGNSSGLPTGDEFFVRVTANSIETTDILVIGSGNVASVVTQFNNEINSGPLAGLVVASDAGGLFHLETTAEGSDVSIFMSANLGLGMQNLGFGNSAFAQGLTANQTYNNNDLSHLVDDLSAAIFDAGLDSDVEVSENGGKLSFRSLDDLPFSLHLDDLAGFGFSIDPENVVFTAVDNGLYFFDQASLGGDRTPILVTSVRPEWSSTSLPATLDEGDVLSITTDRSNGLSISYLISNLSGTVSSDTITVLDPSEPDLASLVETVTVTTPDLVVHDLLSAPQGFQFQQGDNLVLEFSATDKDGGTAVLKHTLAVGNADPVAVHTGDLTGADAITPGTVVRLDARGSFDPGPLDTISFDWDVTSNNGQSTPRSDLALFDFTPTHSGRYEALLTVIDNDGASSVKVQTIDVLPTSTVVAVDRTTDERLVGDAVSGQYLSLSAEDTTYEIGGGPAGLAPIRTWDWSVSDGSNVVATGSGPGADLYIASGGVFEVSLTITDTFGSGANEVVLQNTIVRSITATDSTPTIDTPVGTILEGDFVDLVAVGLPPLPAAIGATESDRTYSWIVGHQTLSIVDSFSTEDQFRFVPRADGGYDVTVFVTDTVDGHNVVHTATSTFAVDDVLGDFAAGFVAEFQPGVTPDGDERFIPFDPHSNDPIKLIGVEGLTYVTHFETNDPGYLDIYDVTWQLRDAADNLIDSGSDAFEFDPTDNGIFTVNVTATETGSGHTINDSFGIQIDNVAPVVDAGEDQVILESVVGTTVSFNGQFSDVGASDGPFHVTWDFGDGTTLSDPTGALITPSHQYEQSGDYVVTMTVSDKDGGVSVDSVSVQIVNQAPQVLDFVADTTTIEVGDRVTFSGFVADNQFDTLRASIAFGDGQELPVALQFESNAGTESVYRFQTQHRYTSVGLRQPVLIVRDGDGEFVESRGISVEVIPPIGVPVVTAIHGPAATVEGIFESLPNTDYTIEYFATQGDQNSVVSGQRILGTTSITTDAFGEAAFSADFAGRFASGESITVRATESSGRISTHSNAVDYRITVNTTDDLSDGACDTTSCSLREAIEFLNGLAPVDTNTPDIVFFDIPGAGPHVISPTAALPTITDGIVIDATTEPDFAGTPVVQIDGADAIADGLKIAGSQSGIAGLIITNFTDSGIELFSGQQNLVRGNYLGIDANSAAQSNYHGLRVQGASENLIDGNTISGNERNGIFVSSASSSNVFVNNMIGTDATGSFAVGNLVDGITLFGPNNQVGVADNGNVISGNGRWGIFSRFEGGNTIQANFIGTDSAGANALPNSSGIELRTASNVVGGASPSEANVISGNSVYGISIVSVEADGNQILGNKLGTDVTGTVAIANAAWGVRVVGGSGNQIGGAATGEGNLISGNGLGGALIASANVAATTVAGNRIGTDVSGFDRLPNGGDGIRVQRGATNTTIRENQIAGNAGRGIATADATTIATDILFNTIGIDAAGAAPLHNSGSVAIELTTPESRFEGNQVSAGDIGLLIHGDAVETEVVDNIFGTDVTGSANLGMQTAINLTTGAGGSTVSNNVITNNIRGVVVGGGIEQVRISENSIYQNLDLGIDINDDGLTANDFIDVDSGTNRLQNSPVISAASIDVATNTLNLTYQVDSLRTASSYSIRIEFFISDDEGQGKTFIGHDFYLGPEVRSHKTISLNVAGLSVGDKITATATDRLGNSSEFGDVFTVDSL